MRTSALLALVSISTLLAACKGDSADEAASDDEIGTEGEATDDPESGSSDATDDPSDESSTDTTTGPDGETDTSTGTDTSTATETSTATDTESDDDDDAETDVDMQVPDMTVDMGPPGLGCGIHVNQANGDDSNLGLTWLDAKETLQAALEAAEGGDCGVYVAAGTYRPSLDNRSESFLIPDGVQVYGGFAGNELFLDQRDWIANPTVLSGDIGTPGDIDDNSWHVVIAAGNTRLDGFEIRHGFSGGAGAVAQRHGAGIRVAGNGFTLANSIVADNRTGDGLDNELGPAGGAGGCGGGMYAGGGEVRIENVTFTDNRTGDGGMGDAQGGSGGAGAGLCSEFSGGLEIVDSVFVDNQTGAGKEGVSQFGGSGGRGGGAALLNCIGPIVVAGSVFEGNSTGPGAPGGIVQGQPGANGGLLITLVASGSVVVVGSEFIANEARFGAGLDIDAGPADSGSGVYVVNTVIRDNVASTNGAGMRVISDGSVPFVIANTAIVDNSAVQGAGGILVGPLTAFGPEQPRIVNSIIWGNTAPSDPQMRALPGNQMPWDWSLDHVALQGGCLPAPHTVECGLLFDVDPMFEDLLAGDLHLQPMSMLVDAGDSSALPPDLFDLDEDRDFVEPTPFDFDGLDRVVGAAVDLGPFELQ